MAESVCVVCPFLRLFITSSNVHGVYKIQHNNIKLASVYKLFHFKL